jgi:PhzF family phenazine biosynthesis protein
MPPVKFWQVDAFTARPFAGNPAAVCWLEQNASAAWMQAVATEMNLSETAFVHRGDDGYALRWFTPTTEVDLCGHATLASAHVLATERLHLVEEPIRLHTRSGMLTCKRHDALIRMDFPATPVLPVDAPSELLDALGVSAVFVGKSRFDHLVVLEDAESVRSLAPDFRRLKAVQARGVIVTSPSDDDRYDFISRFFAPAAGIDEDPVTGSAHCVLGPYWGEMLGRAEMTGFQASSRGGIVQVQVARDRVCLGGRAATVLKGELTGQI